MTTEESTKDLQSADRALLFLETLRKSSKMAQEMINANREMALKISSLDAELNNSKTRASFLEREITQLRNGIAKLAFGDSNLVQDFEELLEEQNCLAHLFVTTEQFVRVQSPQGAMEVAWEVLHNLVGARRFGIWLCWEEGGDPVLVKADGPVDDLKRLGPLVKRCIETGESQQPEGVAPTEPPICVPLRSPRGPTGAVVVAELVPQRPHLERLHRDLLGLLSERLAWAVELGAINSKLEERKALWSALRPLFPAC